MSSAVVGLDIGTTTVKAIGVVESGEVIGLGSSAPLTMSGDEQGWSVQDPDEIIESTHAALARLVESAGPAITFVGVAMAAQSGSVIGLDAGDKPVTDLITWMDTRAADIVEGWKADGTATRVRNISGWDVGCGLGLSTIAWLARHDAATHGKIARFASADDFITHVLTGRWRTNPSNAAGMQLMDVSRSTWSDELCDLAGTEPSRLSRLVPCGSLIGELNDAIRRRVDFATPLTLVAGGHDQSCAALALGITEPGQCLLATGTAWVLTTILDADPTAVAPSPMNISRHVNPDRLTASQYLGGFGASMHWWAQTALGNSGEPADFEELDREVVTGQSSATDLRFLVTGRDATGKSLPGAGVFVSGDEAGAFLGGDRARLTAAVMDVAAQAVAAVLGGLDEVATLTMVGGATRGEAWPQAVADVTGRAVRVVTEETLPARAAAAMAGTALGLFANQEVALAKMSLEPRIVYPSSVGHRQDPSR